MFKLSTILGAIGLALGGFIMYTMFTVFLVFIVFILCYVVRLLYRVFNAEAFCTTM